MTIASQLIGVRELRKKSMAATLAARELAAMPSVDSVALAQAWAYGGPLYLGNDVGLIDLPPVPNPDDLSRSIQGVDAVALYQNALTDAQRAVLRMQGFAPARVYRWGRSRPVAVFLKGKI